MKILSSSPLALRSHICKTRQKTVRAIFFGLLMLPVFLIVLGLVFNILFYIYSALWIGKPIEVACQKFDSIWIDCTLTHQALLRSSEREIKDVQGMDIDYHDS